MVKYEFNLEELQKYLDETKERMEFAKKEAKENGYYIDENNQLKQIEMVWVLDINYKFLDDYLGDSDWIIKYGKGTKEIEEDKVKEIIDIIKDDEYGIDTESISEIIGDAFGWFHNELSHIQLYSARIDSGTIEDRDLNITFDVRTEVREYRFEKCTLCIRREEKQKVDIDHWEQTGCR